MRAEIARHFIASRTNRFGTAPLPMDVRAPGVLWNRYESTFDWLRSLLTAAGSRGQRSQLITSAWHTLG